MVDKDVLFTVTYNLYKSQIDRIKNYAKQKKISEASAMRDIVDGFFNKSKIKIFLNYSGYPIIITALMLYVAVSTSKLTGILLEKNYYFDELYIQQQIYYIMGFAWLSITAASFYWIWHKLKGD